MAETATVARPYAEALFKVAKQGNLDAVAVQLSELAQIAEQPQLQSFAANPNTEPEQVVAVMSSIVKTSLSETSANFLRALIENRRLGVLPEINQQFIRLKNSFDGFSDAVVESAFPIGGSDLAALVSVLEKRFKRKLNATVKLVPELIGGVRVVVGDEVLDTSVKARLEQMKVALIS
jgi:F-type H+-transporting ATPase subunit delta